MKSILDFTNKEARTFFLKEKSYSNFDLPLYFVFSPLIEDLSKKVGNRKFSELCVSFKTNPPNGLEDVNYVLLNNKDGKYSWRPFQLIHPVLYVYLVHKITEVNNWELILNRLKSFQKNSVVNCVSLPAESQDHNSDKAEQVTNWFEEIEQQSLIFGLEYGYVYHTDITDCYGSIYTHSVPWALHTKEEAKKIENRKNQELVGNVIDVCLQAMSYGQTNGIPQGSVLMDFIAELVLGYADEQLTLKLLTIESSEYKILRYRDDYRIFANSPEIAENILKSLTEVLLGLGFKLNSGKTLFSGDVLETSIKPDKSHWIQYGHKGGTLYERMKRLHGLSAQYSNSGSLVKGLKKFYDKIEKLDKLGNGINPLVLISYAADIAYRNPRTYPISMAIMSKLLLFVEPENKKSLIEKLKNKFSKLPNTGYLDIWMQRMTIKTYPELSYPERICKKVSDDKVKLWNNDWLMEDLKKIVEEASIVSSEKIKSLEEFIAASEVELFKQQQES